MANKKFNHIAIAGNIGAGKTTLTQLLSEHYGWEPNFEVVEDNPYLSDFYDEMMRWSFNLQVFFLNSRLEQINKIKESDKIIIQDRTIFEDAYIFAPNLHNMGLMSTRDFDTYQKLFKNITHNITPPDLMIYLKASISTLVDNIQVRAREYEENIRIDYLKKLNGLYESWIETYSQGPLLIIDVDDIDFINNKADFGGIIEKIDKEINGLF